MTGIVTLIAAPDKAILDAAAVARARRALAGSGAVALGGAEWLADAAACDLRFRGATPHAAQAAITSALGDLAVDVVAQEARHRRKRLLVADMDSTVITIETVDALAARAGVGARVAAITERTMRGALDFEASLRARTRLLAGLEENAVHEVRDREAALAPGARTLVRTMRANGAYTVLVSGGFTVFTAAVADRAGFDAHQGNRLVIADGRLSGEIAGTVINRGDKRAALEALARERGITLGETMAVGDGANDLDMLARAGLGVAFRAKPVVAAAAPARIEHGDLTALLFVQGYRSSEFVA